MAAETEQDSSGDMGKYLRFAAMIATGMVVMYWVMFVSSWQFSDVRFSQSRVFMALTMGGAMGLVMLCFMQNMYGNAKANIAIILASLLLFGTGTALDRSQVTVDDEAFMSGMIPHHSLAITRAERAGIQDVRVCELAYAISEAQRKEIDEMDWLLRDIEENGVAGTLAEAEARPVPEFNVSPVRDCPGLD